MDGGLPGIGAERRISTIMTSMHLEDPLVRTSEVTAHADAPSRHGAALDDPVPPSGSSDGTSRWRIAITAAVVIALGVSIWLRFSTKSALWLDEALTVNIARAPLRAIPGLLRDDGAPPLYYYLLHFWMAVFGQSNLAVRSLAGVTGVITLPLAWLTGYRVGSHWWTLESASPAERVVRHDRGRTTAWAVTLLMAMSPFDVYYDTEARMYALLILLGTLTVLSVTSLLRRPTAWNAAGLAVVTSASLYTHYWALYSTAAVAIAMALCAWKGPYRRAGRYAVAGLIVGGLTFLPWLATLWFQTHHTGTPWAAPAQLTAVVFTVTQFAGANSEAVGTPAIDSGFTGDVYLTLDEIGGSGSATAAQEFPGLPGGSVAIGVVIEPLTAWIWTGGLMIGLGGLLALSPGRRRRATDPVSGAAPLDDELEDVPLHESHAAPIANGRGELGDREGAAEPVVTAGR